MKKQQQAHTAVPWSYKHAYGEFAREWAIYGAARKDDGSSYAPIFRVETEAEAAFIVKACNSHDALVALIAAHVRLESEVYRTLRSQFGHDLLQRGRKLLRDTKKAGAL